ncbi:hypothetical protein RJ639_044394 [Escallonia herrerae]|uniref:C3HC-type domain-containing protein n=1 Tax=Escallonia herrerae TaxID=1293975 RepID=A0AA88WDQ3_9ASTE|nr:hypothetical protein RJ639_044394 [Escallonia herrerae]
MAEESEKRFHAVMDKLFHAPPISKSKSTAAKSASLGGVQLPRGKKRPSATAALAVEHSAPLCRPWDRGDLLRRLATFKSMTWFAKPEVHSKNKDQRQRFPADDYKLEHPLQLLLCQLSKRLIIFAAHHVRGAVRRGAVRTKDQYCPELAGDILSQNFPLYKLVLLLRTFLQAIHTVTAYKGEGSMLKDNSQDEIT